MRTIILLLSAVSTLLFALPQTASAQRQPTYTYEARAGVGVLPTFSQDRVNTELLPVLFEFRAKLNPRYSLGLLVGHSISEAERTDPGSQLPRTYRNAFTVVGLRNAVHFSPQPRWDAYGGMTIGYSINQVTGQSAPPSGVSPRDQLTPRGAQPNNTLFFSAFVGGTYQVGKHLGVFGELGFGISVLSTGLSYRF